MRSIQKRAVTICYSATGPATARTGPFLTINGRRHYLWRAVDQDGNVLDILVQPRRDAKAAKRFFRKLLTKQCRVPRVLVTDTLRSYQVAHRAVMPSVEHRQSRYLNNRAENSHQPTRQRERATKRFRTPGGAQRSLAVFSVIFPHFRPRRHRLTADDYRTEMTRRFAVWNEVTGLTAAAWPYHRHPAHRGPARPDPAEPQPS